MITILHGNYSFLYFTFYLDNKVFSSLIKVSLPTMRPERKLFIILTCFFSFPPQTGSSELR